MEIKTTDLWLGAFALSKGCVLERVARENGQTVVFYFHDPHSRELEKEFISGCGMVNITALKANMTHIKDVMFNILRNGQRFHHRVTETQG